MGEIEQRIVKDPNPETTLRDVLDDIVARNEFDRKLVRFDLKAKKVVKLVYQTTD